VELIHRRLLDMLKRRGVTVVESVGQPFDPHRHQAVIYEPAEGRPDGEVIEEFARGYLIGDRLLRPAMVKVAKA
jgi:molecular chaperone GrpE